MFIIERINNTHTKNYIESYIDRLDREFKNLIDAIEYMHLISQMEAKNNYLLNEQTNDKHIFSDVNYNMCGDIVSEYYIKKI